MVTLCPWFEVKGQKREKSDPIFCTFLQIIENRKKIVTSIKIMILGSGFFSWFPFKKSFMLKKKWLLEGRSLLEKKQKGNKFPFFTPKLTKSRCETYITPKNPNFFIFPW